MLVCYNTGVSDLSPLKQARLTYVHCGRTQVSNLSPLQGMPLTYLACSHTTISDLAPLKGMPLINLSCNETLVTDLSPLENCQSLHYLNCDLTNVSDLSPLQGMSLTDVRFPPQKITKGLEVIRQMKSLKSIGPYAESVSPAEFWKKYDAGEFGKPVVANQPWNTPAFQAWVKEVQAMPAEKQIEAVSKKLVEMNPGFDGKVAGVDTKITPKIENGVVTSFGFFTDNVTDISPLRALTSLKQLNCTGTVAGKMARLSDLSPLRGIPLTILRCDHNQVSDLSPLAGMPLTHLNCYITQVSDLVPLRGMPLTFVHCANTQVSDLSPLQGMKLTHLECYLTHVSDLSPIKGMPLTTLDCFSTPASDLSPLEGMNCDYIAVTPNNITKGLDVIRQMKSLKLIGVGGANNSWPPAEFWKKYDAGEFGKPATPAKLAYLDPDFQQWMKGVQALPAEKQVEAVRKKLMELNPGFDGKVAGFMATGEPKIENGVVTGFGFFTDNVTDISPVKALAGMKSLDCIGTALVKGQLSNLSPLKGMSLTRLNCSHTLIDDLSPLRAAPLTHLFCDNTQVSDLSSLRGMKLTALNITSTQVTDLSPLNQMPLDFLAFGKTKVIDLSPIVGMSLTKLLCYDNPQLSDLSPLTKLPALRTLDARRTKVTAASVATLQKALPNCKIEWDDPAKAATNQPWNTPAFQQWLKEVQALPAEKQIEAVSKKLMELNPGFDGKVTGYEQKGTPKIENGVVNDFSFSSDNVSDLSPVRAFAGLLRLDCRASGIRKAALADLSPLAGLKLTTLQCYGTIVSNLSPLAGMPLTYLNCNGTKVADLSPLHGMPLRDFDCGQTQVADLSPLKGSPLRNIQANQTPVSDLSPLLGMPFLERLIVPFTQVSELSPLLDCKSLTTLILSKTKVTAAGVAAVQKALPNCKIEWDDPAKAAAGQPNQPWNTPAFQQWVKEVQALPAEKQIEAVSKKLMELNPGFDGILTAYEAKRTPRIENGVVTELNVSTDSVSDISAVRALAGLRKLRCVGGASLKGALSDISPLQGMPLKELEFSSNLKLSDLSPLHGLELTRMTFIYTKVSDLSPLKGMPLKILSCGSNPIADLSPLEGMQLTNLNFGSTKVSDLSPLRGMPLKDLGCYSNSVSDLAPLAGMPLMFLNCRDTTVSDLSPLQDCKSLSSLSVKNTKVTAAGVAAVQKALPNCKIEWDDPAKPTTPEPATPSTK